MSDMIFLLRKDPQTEAEHHLLSFMQQIRTWGPQAEWDRLIDEGGFWTPRVLPPGYHYDAVRGCFMNAGRRALFDEHLTYVEGYGYAGFPTHHAWLIDGDGAIIDTTWRTRNSKYKIAVSSLAYYGIPFDDTALRLKTLRTKTWGMLFENDRERVYQTERTTP